MNAKHFFYLLMACGLFCFLYSPAQLYFLSDDWDSLLNSLHPANILHSYRPLADASLYLDYSIWKMNASGFHLTNFILHFACVFCIYLFSKIIFGLQSNHAVSSKLALLSSLLFLVYPFHSEALFWIVGRGAILCTLFALLSCIFFMKKEKSRWYYLLSLLCFVCALLSYEEAWILPVIIVVLLWVKKPVANRLGLLCTAGFGFVFALYFLGRYAFTNDVIGTPYGSARMIDFNLFRWCKNAAALVARSVVLPMQSSFVFVVVCVIVIVTFAAVLYFVRKKINLAIVFSSVCFLLSLLPVIPLGIDTHDTESERFLYFPSVFFSILLIQLFCFVFEKKLWLAVTIFIAENIALWQSYNNFAASSAVSRATISMLYKSGKADTIFCHHLPDEYKGAFVFRNGFESAVKLIPQNSATQVVISSRAELFHPEKNYKAELIEGHLNNDKNKLEIDWQEDKVVFTK